MEDLKKQYKLYFRNKTFWLLTIEGFLLLAVSMFANFWTAYYAAEKASNSVTDIVLSNIPVFDVDGTFIYGPLVVWIVVIFLCLKNPKYIPFTLKNIALFILIRSIFVSLTHISPFPDQIAIESNGFISKFSSGADLFFSAHTGLPFLMALTFWNKLYYRIFFILSSIFFGVVVLLGHLHYSIDVLSAFFITYAIYHIAIQIFKNDFKIFRSGFS